MTYLRFEDPRTDEMSPDIGPFEFVQITYGDLRLGPDGDRTIAGIVDHEWIVCVDFAREYGVPENVHWSDLVLYGYNEETRS